MRKFGTAEQRNTRGSKFGMADWRNGGGCDGRVRFNLGAAVPLFRRSEVPATAGPHRHRTSSIPRRQRGAVLIVVLAVLGGLVAIMAGLAATQRINFKAQLNRMEMRKAEFAANAGIQRALATLQIEDPNAINQEGEWYDLGTIGGENFVVGDASFRLQVLDAGSLLNLNTATQQHLEHLPLTTEQIESLLDWKSAGQTARTEGAKDDYYHSLETPYNAKLANLTSVDEVLLVKGWDAATLYEYDPEKTPTTPNAALEERQLPISELVTVDSEAPNVNAQGQPKANINTATMQQLIQGGIQPQTAVQIIQRRNQGTFANMGAVLRVPGVNLNTAATLLDNFQVGTAATTTGRINLNTASEAVLETIEGMTPDMSAAIVTRQTTPFARLGELTTIPGVNLAFLQNTADMFTTGSTTFHVRVIGTAGQTSVPLEAVVRIQGGRARLVRVQRPPQNDMRARWEWDDDTTTETVLSEEER